MTRKRLVMIIIIVLVLGGLFMFFNLNGETKEEYAAKLFRQEQENIARYLVNEYENIKSIEFDRFSSNFSRGSQSFFINLNEDIRVEVTYYPQNDNDYILTFHKNDQNLVENDEMTTITNLKNVKISYYGD